MNDAISIIMTGDFYPGGGRVRALSTKRDAEFLMGNFLPLIRRADLAVTNLESPLIENGKSIEKTGPVLKSSPKSIELIKSSGFNIVTLANNHMMDYGEKGLLSTIDICHKHGIETMGGGKSLDEAKKPYYFELNGIKIAIINIAENEFGTTQGDKPGCNPLNPVQNFYSIKNASKSSDHVIVIVHGGHENYELPSPRMKQTYRFFVDNGASAVIGHHTHCTCGYEIYKKAPICYSLGNFLFDKPERNGSSIKPWNEGLVAELVIKKKEIQVEYHPYIQNFDTVGIRKMKAGELNSFRSKINRLNNIISDDKMLQMEFENYCERSFPLYSSYIEPHSNRLLHALRNRNIIPSLLSERKKRLLLNLTRCEAHRDILLKILSK